MHSLNSDPKQTPNSPLSFLISHLILSRVIYKTIKPTTPNTTIAIHALPFDSAFGAAAPVYWLGAPVPVALVPPTGVGV